MVALIYIVLVFTIVLVLLTEHYDRSWLYLATQEDGFVEWLTVLALLYLAGLLFSRIRHMRPETPKWFRRSGYLLAALSILAAGEEISWGQRQFGIETPEALEKVNHQGELNLHNLVPAELFNGVIIFSVVIALVLVPLIWRLATSSRPWWLPSEHTSLLTISIALVNHYRVTSTIEKVGLIALFLLLAAGTVRSLWMREKLHTFTCAIGWATGITLYLHRHLLPAANHQYEIRELLIVLVVTYFCTNLLKAWTPSE